MRKTLVTLFVMAGLSSSGCAWIVSGGDQALSFDSDPPGATITIDGEEVGTTPTTVTWDRGGADLHIEISKEGYEPYRGFIESGYNTWFLLNLFNPSATSGTTTDATTGALFEYEPSSYHAVLAPASAERQELWKHEMQIARFVLKNYAEFSADLLNGEGHYLDAALAQVDSAGFETQPGLAQLRKIQDNSQTPVQFASRLLDILRND